ncbi:hypothetical protein BC938DRAFT_479879 [Jimgerdemannia flammicorona]|uniref:Uncharacterized protein n=1 Tax=Jimgerdemannia flammicorona TaxID=994334 RepID=A0A433QJX8_9FUNG|nr:hypothetical protein BC938DRAFT_479879 [Jimgerdemannia flammicorona]
MLLVVCHGFGGGCVDGLKDLRNAERGDLAVLSQLAQEATRHPLHPVPSCAPRVPEARCSSHVISHE